MNKLLALFHPQRKILLNDFRKSAYFSEEAISLYQNNKLQSLIRKAYDTVPYYHDLFLSRNLSPLDIKSVPDLQKLPLLTKDIIREEGNRMYSQNISNYYITSTSGSTGNPLQFRKTSYTKDVENALFARFLEDIGYNDGDKTLVLWGHLLSYKDQMKLMIGNFLTNTKRYNIYDLSLKREQEILQFILANSPSLIRSFPSALYEIALLASSKKIRKPIPIITTSAEKLYSEQRLKIAEVFGPNIYDQYGSSEIQTIAFECNNHSGLHHAFEHSILEVLDNENHNSKYGRVVLTDLDNDAMPLIRYENGDMASLSETQCQCGRHSQVISSLDGRVYDSLITSDGKLVLGGFVDEIIVNSHFLRRGDISQFRIIQTSISTIRIDYVADHMLDDSIQKDISEAITQKMGNSIYVSYKRFNDLPQLNNGKRRFVVSLEEYQKNKELYQ